MSGPPSRVVRLVVALGVVPTVEELAGETRIPLLLGLFGGKPPRSGGAAGVPSPAPPPAVASVAMPSSDYDDPNGQVTPVSYGWAKPAPTQWEFKRVKTKNGGRQAMGKNGSEGRRWWSLSRRDPRKAQTIQVWYEGGAEAWYGIRARGRIGKFPGYVALHDAMREIDEGRSWYIEDGPKGPPAV